MVETASREAEAVEVIGRVRDKVTVCIWYKTRLHHLDRGSKQVEAAVKDIVDSAAVGGQDKPVWPFQPEQARRADAVLLERSSSFHLFTPS